ncbi:DUF5518 domain-containing protein [Halobacteria archaeon HArc-gm2]|nr:DUF5518 domain-containing protein [Halobacteria archaeon HArc-gm2]
MIGALRNFVTDHPWAYALPAGLGSAAYVLNNAPETGVFDYNILLWAGLIGGVMTLDGRKMAHRVGLRTGLVASLPLVWNIATVGAVIPTFDQPLWFGIVQTVLLLAAVTIGVLFVAVAGALSAALGNWLSQQVGSGPASSTVQT